MRSANASAAAHSVTLPLVSSACAAAPVPRPPQPISATLISSLPETWADLRDLSVHAQHRSADQCGGRLEKLTPRWIVAGLDDGFGRT